MTSFGWKRKVGEKFSKDLSKAFDANAKDDNEDDAIINGEVDWLHLVPKRRAIQLEDGVIKAKRLRDEGGILAEQERYWEALQKWDESIMYNPGDEAVYEMKAQAYMQVGEVLPAIQAARKSISIKPHWWTSHQTLGRALMGVGEVKKALCSFSKALHLNPGNEELWEEDFRWAMSLYQQSIKVKQEKNRLAEQEKAAKIVELDEDGFCKEVIVYNKTNTIAADSTGAGGIPVQPKRGLAEHLLARPAGSGAGPPPSKKRKLPPRQGSTLPPSYVCLRDSETYLHQV